MTDTYTIRELEWTKGPSGWNAAKTRFGRLTVWQDCFDSALANWIVEIGNHELARERTEEAAQSAAQQWFRERMLGGLVRVEATQKQESKLC